MTATTVMDIAVSNTAFGVGTFTVRDDFAIDAYAEAMPDAQEALRYALASITARVERTAMQIPYIRMITRVGVASLFGGLLSLIWTLPVSFDAASLSAGSALFGIGLLATARFWMLCGKSPQHDCSMYLS